MNMIKRLLLFSLALCSFSSAFAQFTAVTGTIVDGDGTTWFNSKVQVTFVPNPAYPNFNQYNINGVNLTTSSVYNPLLNQNVTANSGGQFNVQLLDNTKISPGGSSWKFTIQSYTSAPSAVFPNLAVQGTSTDVSAFILANITPPRFPAATNYGGAYGYGTNEISVIPVPGGSFFNITIGAPETWTCQDNTPCMWVINSLGSLNCPTLPGCGAQFSFTNNVLGTQGPTDTTLVLSGNTPGYPTSGIVLVDSEWEKYTGISGNTLTGITRAYNLTTANSHFNGAQVISVVISFNPINQLPQGALYGGTPELMSLNCLAPSGINDAGNLAVFQANCFNNAFIIDTAGAIHQVGLGTLRNFMGPIYIGGQFADQVNSELEPVPITNTTNVVQTNNPNQLLFPIGLSGGIAGAVKAVPASTIGPLVLTNNFIGTGSCAITYDVTGVDQDGGIIPGTPTTISGLASAWSFPASVGVQIPMTGGIITYNLYRTVVTGCGTLATGKVATVTGQFNTFSDQYNFGDGTIAPVLNTSIGKQCVGYIGNAEGYCILAGTSSTPPLACTSQISNWEYKITGTTTAPFTLRCKLGTWVDSNSFTTSGATGTYPYPASITTSSGLVTSVTPGTTQHLTQVLIITTGICSTSNSASNICTMSPVNWPVSFGDTSYSATCTPSAPTTGLQANIYVIKSATGVTIQLQNGQNSAAVVTTVGEIDCYGVHT